MGDKPERAIGRGFSRGSKGGPSRGRKEGGGIVSGFRGKQSVQGGRDNDADSMSMKFGDFEGLDADSMMEAGGPAADKMVDGDFFNRFGDPFDESDMKPGGAPAPLPQKLATPQKNAQPSTFTLKL